MLRLSIVTLFTVFFGLTATAIQANTVERIFPQAEPVAQKAEKGVHYLLPLGRVKDDRSAGRVQPSRFERLQGDLTALTWRLGTELSLQDAHQQLEAVLAAENPERLFYCEGRDCGESFLWANSIFQRPVLFGSDRNQYLWVIRDPGQPRYHILYLIERPNRRIYLHEESLLVPEGMETAGQIKLLLERVGRVRVGDVPLDGGKADFASVVSRVKAWQADVGLPVLLVLHRHGNARTQDALAEQLRKSLMDAGVTGRVEDVGALAPDANAGSLVWVEWVNEHWVPVGM